MARGTVEGGLPMTEGSFTPMDISALAVAPVALGYHAAGQIGEIGEIAAVQRHLGDLFVGGDLAPRAALGIQSGRRVGDGDALAGGADFERNVDAHRLVHRQRELGAPVGAESGAAGL